ncbi:MAG: hypothetical protein RL181_1024 [Bacteroidota bacterium]
MEPSKKIIMKNTGIFPFISFLFRALPLLLLFAACDKEIENPRLEALAPAGSDATGGTWKPFLIPDVTALKVPVPSALGSAAYLAELAAVRAAQAGAGTGEKEALAWWSAGAVYRWQEIARELAARYNLPPKSNPDGSYPSPDATRPCDYPKFPFANPPYASRAFAYLSVAQYDALVAAWHFKFLHRRPAAYRTDTRIQNLKPATELPAYPSEDAVVAGASVEILKAMFPCEAGSLEERATEHLESLLLSGHFTRSDLDAGSALGRQVALTALTRSRNDGMRNAGNQAVVAQYTEQAKARGLSTPWTSQEIPARPGMLPGFGALSPWNFDPAMLPSLRPAAPPAVGSDAFRKDMDELLGYARHLTREQQRIANFWSDGPGSYTPPGHWNRIAADLARSQKLSELRSARVMALTSTAVADAGIACWEAKYYYMYPRPFQMNPRIKTVVGLPNFPAYTSGHSTFSSAAATVLSYLFPEKTIELESMAKEASESRIYGCIHYRFDCEAGLLAGREIGKLAAGRGRADGSPQ